MNRLTHSLVATSSELSSAHPVQYTGYLTDGRWFYFRYRFGRAQLGFGDTELDAVDEAFEGRDRVISIHGDVLRGHFETDAERDVVFSELMDRRLANDHLADAA